MKTQRRQQYLQEMGIRLWRPHTVLPGAKASTLIRRKPASVAVPSQNERPRKQRLQSAASILAEHEITNHSDSASAVAKPPAATMPPVQRAAPVAEGAKAVTVSLFIAECPGELLIIDSTAESREHQQLIRNLLFAITQIPANQYRFTPIDGRQLGSTQASVSDLAFGVVDRSTLQNKTTRLLLLGDAAIELFQGAVGVKGAQTLPGFASAMTVAASHGSAAMLSTPPLKRETWAHVQCLCKQ